MSFHDSKELRIKKLQSSNQVKLNTGQ